MLPLWTTSQDVDSKRIIILGESRTSNLLSHLSLLNPTQCTLSKFRIQDKEYLLEFLNIPSSRHPWTRRVYYKKAQGVILLYESHSEMSYKKCKKWLQEFRKGRIQLSLDPNVPTLVIGDGKTIVDKKCSIAQETNGFSITADLSNSSNALLHYESILNSFYSLVVQKI